MSLIQVLLALALAPQATAGALTVVSEPGAVVVWDGVELGRTNAQGRLAISGIPLGDYRVEVSKQGFKALSRQIEVEPGHRSIAFQLVAAEPAVAPGGSVERPVRQAVAAVSNQPKSVVSLEVGLPSGGVQERRASQVPAAPFEMPWAWFLLPAVLLTGLLVWFLRNQASKPPIPAHGLAADEFRDPFPLIENPPSPQGPSPVSFLEDLRRREVLADRGVAAPPQDDLETAIDLDESDVRFCEEQEDA